MAMASLDGSSKEEAWLTTTLRAANAAGPQGKALQRFRWQALAMSRQSCSGGEPFGTDSEAETNDIDMFEDVLAQARLCIGVPVSVAVAQRLAAQHARRVSSVES